MQNSIDSKPVGAFIEYTLKPLIEDSRELIELSQKHGLDINSLLKKAAILYVFHSLLNFILTLIVTGIIGYVCLKALNSHLIRV